MLAQYPFDLGFLTLSNSIHAAILGKSIEEMKLGEEPKRIHYTKSLLANNFVQDHTKIAYAHQDVPDDSIYRVDIDFSYIVSRIPTFLENTQMFQY